MTGFPAAEFLKSNGLEIFSNTSGTVCFVLAKVTFFSKFLGSFEYAET
jgi:hypothetical protein